MFLNFLIEELGQSPQMLWYEGDFKIRDLEEIYEDLMKPEKTWFDFKTKSMGFITRREFVKSVYLSEQKGVFA